MSALTTVENLKRYMRLAGDEHDDALAQIIGAVTDAVEQYCRRPFARAETSEIFDGSGGASVFLRRRPIESVAAVWDDPTRAFRPESALPESAYLFNPATGVLSRTVGRFSSGRQRIRVDYVGGYATTPPSLAQAVHALAAHYFLRGRQGGDGVASESLGAYSVSFDTADWPGHAKTLLDEFREWSV